MSLLNVVQLVSSWIPSLIGPIVSVSSQSSGGLLTAILQFVLGLLFGRG